MPGPPIRPPGPFSFCDVSGACEAQPLRPPAADFAGDEGLCLRSDRRAADHCPVCFARADIIATTVSESVMRHLDRRDARLEERLAEWTAKIEGHLKAREHPIDSLEQQPHTAFAQSASLGTNAGSLLAQLSQLYVSSQAYQSVADSTDGCGADGDPFPCPRRMSSAKVPRTAKQSGSKNGSMERVTEEEREMRTSKYTKKLRAMRDNSAHPQAETDTKENFLVRVVSHALFEHCVIVVLVVSALGVGLQVHHNATRSDDNAVYTTIEYACSALFVVELALRFLAFGRAMWSPAMRCWTLFDSCLVLLSVFDFVMFLVYPSYRESKGMANASVGRLLKILRMSRLLRILRMLRFFSELRVMVTLIGHSFMSLVWLFCMLLAILYITSIIFTQGATDFRDGDIDPVLLEQVESAYGSLLRTMYTLFKSMTGGVSWGEVADPLRPIGSVFFLLFLLYIFCMLFSVLNIVTGVFVDSSIQIAQRDRDVLMTKSERDREAMIRNLLCLLDDIDEDKDGFISKEEAARPMHGVRDQLEALDIRFEDMELMVDVLDSNGDGRIDIQEFVDGLQALHGEAKRSDIRIVLLHTQHILDLFVGVLNVVGLYDVVFQHALTRKQSRSVVQEEVKKMRDASSAGSAASAF